MIPLSEELSSLGGSGLAALDYLQKTEPAPQPWRTQQITQLDAASMPQADLLLTVVKPVRQLVEATAADRLLLRHSDHPLTLLCSITSRASGSLQGMIAGKPTTHDISAERVANHQYLRLHEISREKMPDGKPQYDAFIHIGWNDQKKSYSIIWLDNFWGIDSQSIGAAEPKENELLFLWKDEKGAIGFSNEFSYDPKTDSWQWTMNNVVNGTNKLFGTVKLTRARG